MHLQTKQNDFLKGLYDGLPIGLGYLSVAIGVGIAAAEKGLSVLTALIISMTNLTSAGEIAGIAVIAAGGPFIEMALTQLVINIRYSLMGISLSQKLDSSFSTVHRLIISSFITDEIFGTASRYNLISIKYMYGIAILPYIGWSLGTFIGAASGNILPSAINAALGLAIYGMFTAIVVPAMKKNMHILIAVAISCVISCGIYFLLPGLGFGFSVIIASVTASLAAAGIKARREVAKR